MSDLVSILIPAYNAVEWISATLRSALEQTWTNKEIVVVDDGSMDGTLEVVRQYEAEGVKVVAQSNQGAAAARNRAFQESHGDFIQWLDADDLLSPDKIALQMEMRRGERTLLSCGWAYFLHRPELAEFVPTPLWADLTPADWLVTKLSFNLHMQTGTWLVSRQLTEAAGPWNTNLLGDDDGEYFCRVLLASDGVRFVPGARVYYRASGTSSLSYIERSDRKVKAHWHSMLLHMNYIRSLEDSERVRRACVQYMRNWLIHFYPEQAEIVQEARRLAADFGEELGEPSLSWKYAWIKTLFGWHAVKRAQVEARRLRWTIQRSWDKAMSLKTHRLPVKRTQ